MGPLCIPRKQRRADSRRTTATVAKYDGLAGYLVLGWALHYLPFFIMSRQLFLHHYFPALYFAVLLICTIFDFATRRLNPKIQIQVAGVLLILTIWSWYHFSPIAYGGAWTKSKCEAAKWRSSWDFGCSDFHETVRTPCSSSDRARRLTSGVARRISSEGRRINRETSNGRRPSDDLGSCRRTDT